MSINSKDLEQHKIAYTNSEISPLVFDLICAFAKIRGTESVDGIYLNIVNDKLEIYIFYEKENFDIEDKILKYLTDWQEQYKYFPEIFIYPLDMIESKELTLPKTATKI